MEIFNFVVTEVASMFHQIAANNIIFQELEKDRTVLFIYLFCKITKIEAV